jgi:pimeloyl-ACP methyl ester carboxylesterase
VPVDLHCEVIGRGRPVVLLHGLFGSGRNWFTIARQLAADYAFHLVDLRNHGRSPHAPTMTYTDMVADVRALMARHGLDDVILVGHSMGGKAAMTLALTDPRGIARLINIDIAPVAYPDRFAELIAALRALDVDGIRRRAEAERALTAVIPDQAVRLFILQNLVFRDGRAEWRLNLPVLERDMPHILGPLPIPDRARFHGPTWFIRGELSDRVTDRHLVVIETLFADYRIETVAGGGHWPHAEAPGAFMAAFARALGA